MRATSNHEFGPFRYDPEQKLLFRRGTVVALTPKVANMLQVLLEHRGSVVEKSELLQLVWPDTHVEEIALARTISTLRRVLGDDGEAFVETIPKRGYRFAPIETPALAPEEVTRPQQQPRSGRWILQVAVLFVTAMLGALIYWQFYIPSRFAPQDGDFAKLAVVPFESLAPEVRPFTDGLNVSLPVALAQLQRVRVTSPSTVLRHQSAGLSMGLMGRLLGLDVLVEGTVQPLGDRLRITARLVDVHTGAIVMADSQDRPLTNPRESQEAVVRELTSRIATHLAIHGQFSVSNP